MQVILKSTGPCGLPTLQFILTHIDILGPTFSVKLLRAKSQKKPKYCLHSACFFSTGFDTPCILNFNIVFIHKTLYDIAPMNSLTSENVISVANSENESAFQCRVKPGLQITLKLQGPCGPLTDQVLLAHTDILGPTFSIKC